MHTTQTSKVLSFSMMLILCRYQIVLYCGWINCPWVWFYPRNQRWLGEIMNPAMCNFRRALLNEHQGLSSTVMYSFNIYDKKKHLFLSSSTDCKSYGNWIVVLEWPSNWKIMMQLLFLTLYQTETGLTVSIPDHISNSPYRLPYSYHDVSFENSVLNQLTIAQLIFLFILITCLLGMVLIWWGEILLWWLVGVKG